MKSLLKIGLISLVIVVFSSSVSYAKTYTVRGNGDLVKETRDVHSFDAIDISSAFDVELTQSNKELLIIEADENLMEHIYTEVIGGTLKIYTKGNIRDVHTMKAYISFKDINEIELSGACNVKGMNKMKFKDFKVDASGASEVRMDFTANVVKLDLSGATEIYFTGYADELIIDASGASEIYALDFEVKNCDIEASGATTMKVYVTENLDVDASGASTVKYKGKPAIEIEASGASSVKRY